LASGYYQHTFPGGLTLVAERMAGVQSAAMTLLIPAGVATDPPAACGVATLLSDLVLRGAGKRDSRQLMDHLDGLGLQRSSGVGIHHTHFSCAGVGPKVMAALPAYADIVRRPHMPLPGFEAARDLSLQALAGIEDEPRQKLVIALRENHFPPPLGRNPMGLKEHLQAITLGQCQSEHARRYRGGGAIISFAGNLEFDEVHRLVEAQFGDFNGVAPEPVRVAPAKKSYAFEQQASEQTHIGIAYDSVPPTHPDYYTMSVAMEVLGGGMSGRLFTELREKRGLVYNVWAGYSGLKGLGAILGYAGTSNDRAQATLDCLVGELRRLSDGITSQELERARTGLKAQTIMQGESTSGRSGSIAHDYFMRGHIRTLDEIKEAINAVTLDGVNSYLRQHVPGPFTLVVLGPKELEHGGL
jgi:predicted Zn-dependent peptidase